MFAIIKTAVRLSAWKRRDDMQFPKEIMSLPEIHRELGVPECILRDIARTPGQKCAFRRSVTSKGKIWFFTNKLAKELEKRMAR